MGETGPEHEIEVVPATQPVRKPPVAPPQPERQPTPERQPEPAPA